MLRTDDDFRLQSDAAHHVGTSPLAALPLGLVSQVPLDYMHVVCLGVMRRILLLWSKGPASCRMSNALLQAVSARLVAYRSFIPRQFARKTQSLSEVKMWKATEFRTFLLYTGPVALKGLLNRHLYRHFVCLSVAISICLSVELCHEHADYSESLLVFFVQQFSKLYGVNQVVYNVHCLTHLVDDVRRYGCLDSISAFPFENYLGKLKKMVRNGNNPVSQLVGRLTECDKRVACKDADVPKSKSFKKGHFEGPILCGMSTMEQFKQYETENVFISCEHGDNFIEILGEIGIVRHILREPGDAVSVLFSSFERKESLYTYPLQSEILGIFSLSRLCESCTVHPLHEVNRKYLLLPLPDDKGFAGFPLQRLCW
jgi:hypothetical protein